LSSIIFITNEFFLIDGHKKKTALLKIYDPYNNYSSVPMFEIEDGQKFPLYDLLMSIANDFDRVNKSATQALDKTEVMLPLLLVTKSLLSKHRDFKALEIGCGNGVLSGPLSRLLQPFNRNNQLICVTDTMDADSHRFWLEKVALFGAEEIVSLAAAGYDDALFPKDHFDVVIINGSVPFDEPAKIIYNAINCIKNNGLLIAVSAGQYLLSSCFQVIFDNCTEYYLDSASSVLVKTMDTKDKHTAYKRTDEYKIKTLKPKIASTFVSLKETVDSLWEADYLNGDNDDRIDEKIRMVMRAEDDVLAIFGHLVSLDIKFNISDLKEALISYRLSRDEAERKHFAAVCGRKFQAVISEMRKYADFIM